MDGHPGFGSALPDIILSGEEYRDLLVMRDALAAENARLREAVDRVLAADTALQGGNFMVWSKHWTPLRRAIDTLRAARSLVEAPR